jgi:adenine-specific DNA-methyltransferase
MIEPTVVPFADAATTAVISTFEVGSKPRAIRVRRVSNVTAIEPLDSGRLLHRNRLETQARWSQLTRRAPVTPAGYVELGELCRVHRGQVTGANRIWIAGPHSQGLPGSVLFKAVTRAKELFAADGVLVDDSCLRDVIDLPAGSIKNVLKPSCVMPRRLGSMTVTSPAIGKRGGQSACGRQPRYSRLIWRAVLRPS